jgi:basic membrane protein A
MPYFLRDLTSSVLKITWCIFALFFCLPLWATEKEKPKICMILDKGGKDDHSFNQLAVVGFQKALKTLPINPESKFVEPRTDAQIPLFFNNFSTGANCDLVVAIGFTPAGYLPDIAAKFPNKKFLVIDTNVENKDKNQNIRSVTFEEHEGSFLVGAIAAMKSSTGKIGFIGGMDVPLIHRFELGYVSGAKYINPKIDVITTYVGVTPDSWNNPAKAKELAISQYNERVDVIFQVAAASGQGVFDAAEEFNKTKPNVKHYAIGVDSNQNWVNPKVILTSMEKRVDIALYNTIKDITENKFTSGHVIFGLKEGGVLWSYDENNQKFFTKKDLDKINQIKQDIVNNKITVPDYYKKK